MCVFSFERKNDDMQGEFYRWWSNRVSYELGSETGTDIIMTVPMTPDQWSNINGKLGNQDAEASAGFEDALLNVGRVGMTFGGGCLFGQRRKRVWRSGQRLDDRF